MIAIEPLRPERVEDWLAFFDGPAFDDNPEWSRCYCMFFHFAGSNDAWERACDTGSNRDAKVALIRSEQARGHLAYEDGRVVGWVNAAPRVMLPKLDAFCPVDDREQVGDVVCFVVDASRRRTGVASALLAAACDAFAAEGMRYAEAFPPKDAGSDAHAYRGPLALYRRAGFEIAGELRGHYQVRKPLS